MRVTWVGALAFALLIGCYIRPAAPAPGPYGTTPAGTYAAAGTSQAAAQEPPQPAAWREMNPVAAPDRVGVLGQLYDAHFQPLPGPGCVLHIAPEAVVDRPANATRRFLSVIEDEAELEANARAWMVSASVTASSSERYAVFRVEQVTNVQELSPQIGVPQETPQCPGARYFLSRIHSGRMYEALFHGNRERLGGELSLDVVEGGASIQGGAQTNQVQVQQRTVGLQPVAEQQTEAFFARTEDEVSRFYAPEGAVRPILVTYGALAAPSSTSQAQRRGPRSFAVGLVSVRFPERNATRQTYWDAGGNAPDISIEARQGTRVLGSWGGPQDTSNATTWEPPTTDLGELVVDAAHPLVLILKDIDVMAHDDAGRIEIDSLTDTLPDMMPLEGEQRTFTSDATGVQVTLLAREVR